MMAAYNFDVLRTRRLNGSRQAIVAFAQRRVGPVDLRGTGDRASNHRASLPRTKSPAIQPLLLLLPERSLQEARTGRWVAITTHNNNNNNNNDIDFLFSGCLLTVLLFLPMVTRSLESGARVADGPGLHVRGRSAGNRSLRPFPFAAKVTATIRWWFALRVLCLRIDFFLVTVIFGIVCPP